MDYKQHIEQCAQECEAIAVAINAIAQAVREGDVNVFELFWLGDSAKDKDPRMAELHQNIAVNYFERIQHLQNKTPEA